MTLFGVGVWRVGLGVIVSEAIPILLVVLAMVVVGHSRGAKPSQETVKAYAAWIGPIGGALGTALVAYWLARASPSPISLGLVMGFAVALLDIGLIVVQRPPFEFLFVVSAISRVVGGTLGGIVAGRAALGGG